MTIHFPMAVVFFFFLPSFPSFLTTCLKDDHVNSGLEHTPDGARGTGRAAFQGRCPRLKIEQVPGGPPRACSNPPQRHFLFSIFFPFFFCKEWERGPRHMMEQQVSSPSLGYQVTCLAMLTCRQRIDYYETVAWWRCLGCLVLLADGPSCGISCILSGCP